jgi:hypothetical protein
VIDAVSIMVSDPFEFLDENGTAQLRGQAKYSPLEEGSLIVDLAREYTVTGRKFQQVLITPRHVGSLFSALSDPGAVLPVNISIAEKFKEEPWQFAMIGSATKWVASQA